MFSHASHRCAKVFLHQVIETDDNFQPLNGGFDYLVDFLDLSFPTERPEREHAYEEIKNRVNVMRHVVVNGLLWDDLYIGFNNRMSRDPDVYHHKFWNHFQTELPLSAPDWQHFLQICSQTQENGSSNGCSVS